MSDCHLYHKNTITAHIGQNLLTYFFNDEHLSSVEYAVIAGDMFDSGLNVAEHDVYVGQNVIISILKACKKHNVKLRVLEGTTSHDFRQGIQFIELNTQHKIDCDVLYVKVLDVIKEDDGTIWGYVPDEWHHDSNVTFAQMQKRMALLGVTSLDFCIMHGCFEFQFPPFLKIPSFIQSQWESITNYYIVIGHHHLPNAQGKVIVPGSTDRLAHGEEHPKGGIKIKVNTDTKETSFVRIWNENTKPYITVAIDPIGGPKEVIEYIDALIKAQNITDVSISIDSDDSEKAKALIPILKDRHDDASFIIRKKKKKKSDNVTERFLEHATEDSVIPVTFTKDNTLLMVKDFLHTSENTKIENVSILAELEELMG